MARNLKFISTKFNPNIMLAVDIIFGFIQILLTSSKRLREQRDERSGQKCYTYFSFSLRHVKRILTVKINHKLKKTFIFSYRRKCLSESISKTYQ
jgi:hypothetical protein